MCEDEQFLSAQANIPSGPETLAHECQQGDAVSADGAVPIPRVGESTREFSVTRDDCDTRTSEGASTSGRDGTPHSGDPVVGPEWPRRKCLLPSMQSLFENEELKEYEEMNVLTAPKLARTCRRWQRDIVQKSLIKSRRNANPEFLECLRTFCSKASAVSLQNAVNSWHERKAARLMKAVKPAVPRAESKPVTIPCMSASDSAVNRLLGSRLCAVRGINLDHTPVINSPSLSPLYSATTTTVNLMISAGWP